MRIVHFFRKRPSAVYVVRYERVDGHYRTVTVGVGRGRFKWGRKKDALEIAERRHNEQYGEAALDRGDPQAEALSRQPSLHADLYHFVSVKKRPRRR